MTMMHYQVLLRRVICANKNHRGADKFPEDILLYLEKEKNPMQFWVLSIKIRFSKV